MPTQQGGCEVPLLKDSVWHHCNQEDGQAGLEVKHGCSPELQIVPQVYFGMMWWKFLAIFSPLIILSTEEGFGSEVV